MLLSVALESENENFLGPLLLYKLQIVTPVVAVATVAPLHVSLAAGPSYFLIIAVSPSRRSE